MKKDQVDQLLSQWSSERPELNCDGLSVVVRIQLLARLLTRSAEKALQGLDLQLWEYDVLSALRRQGIPYQLPATELARESMLTSGAMTNRIDRLQARNLVRRDPHPTDGRTVLVTLTDSGLGLIDDAILSRLAAADNDLVGLEASERRLLAGGLRKILLGLVAGQDWIP